MTKFLVFVFDNDSFFINNKNFILTGENLYWLVSFLNSNIFKYCFRNNFPELLGGTRELRKVFFEQLKIKKISPKEEKPFIKLAEGATK